VLLNWFNHQKCMWYPRTFPVLVYITATEPIQRHIAVYLSSWLRWTAMNLRLQQTVTHFYSSAVRRHFRSQVQFVSCGWFLRAFSWGCWRRLSIRRILCLSGWGRLIYLIDRITRRPLQMLKVKWLTKQPITQPFYPPIIYLPVIFNFKYEGIYR
jgi:hypothetical protein